jgi:hypothetical protein
MATSYNGWTAGDGWSIAGGQLEPLVVAGESFSPGVRAGDVHDVFEYLAEQLHKRVEPIVRPDWHQADDWGYSYRPSVNDPSSLSCHASATAIDYNATRHPNGRAGTFTASQVSEIRRILAELGGVVRWGGDFSTTKDEMHFEIIGSASAVAVVAQKIRAFMEDDMPFNAWPQADKDALREHVWAKVYPESGPAHLGHRVVGIDGKTGELINLVHELLNRNSELVTKVDTLVSQNAQLAQQVQELTALLVAHDAEPTTDV